MSTARGPVLPEKQVPAAKPVWQLFHSNLSAWETAFELCESARRSIAIEQYIFSRKGIGDELLELLSARAREGVRVRVLVDAFGSQHLVDSEPARELREAGGEVKRFHGVHDFLRDPRTLIHRLHRKTVICDDDQLLIGGSCFTPRMADWRDTMVRVEGRLAHDALATFEATWDSVERGRTEPSSPGHAIPSRTSTGWSYLVSSPYSPARHEYYRLLTDRIEAARSSVVLTTPYFLPDRNFLRCIRRAAARGVRIRLLVPARSDQPLIDLFSNFFARKLARWNIEVYGYLPGMMHAKLIIIDDSFAAVGSFNLGIDSFKMNLEGAVATVSPEFVGALAEQLERDFAASKRM